MQRGLYTRPGVSAKLWEFVPAGGRPFFRRWTGDFGELIFGGQTVGRDEGERGRCRAQSGDVSDFVVRKTFHVAQDKNDAILRRQMMDNFAEAPGLLTANGQRLWIDRTVLRRLQSSWRSGISSSSERLGFEANLLLRRLMRQRCLATL